MTHPWQKKRPLSPWLPGGASKERRGVSRNLEPTLDDKRCVRCSFCWIYCPEGCIRRGDSYTIDFDYCKGCGVCAAECPKKAIQMVREDQT